MKEVNFSLDNEKWILAYNLKNAGYMPVLKNQEKEINIPLVMSEEDIKLTLKKIDDTGRNFSNIPFELFKDIIVGAMVLSMKYGR